MGRKLTTEDRILWNKVAATTDRGATAMPMVISPQVAMPKPMPQAFKVQPFQIGSKSKPSTFSAKPRPPATPPIDAKASQRMRRGKLAPEGQIDLHGLTQAEALPALTQFIMRAAARDFRLVLVITGKGRDRPSEGPIPERIGVLRQNVPGWLSRPPLGPMVQGVVQAHQRHGGGGAFYVYLRRRK